MQIALIKGIGLENMNNNNKLKNLSKFLQCSTNLSINVNPTTIVSATSAIPKIKVFNSIQTSIAISQQIPG